MSTTDRTAPSATPIASSVWKSFWSQVWRYDKSKISFPVSIRNATGVAIPLVAGLITGHPRIATVVALGALNVSYSDGTDVFRERARRLLLASLCVGLAVFAGANAAAHPALSVVVVGVAAFAAGLMVAFGQTAADIGTVSLVTLIIFGGQALALPDALAAGILAFLGGLLQSALALASWPVRRYQPIRRSLSALFTALAQALEVPLNVHAAPAATAESTAAQETLARYGVDQSDEGERYRSLLNQAERIRLTLLALNRSRRRLEREQAAGHEAVAPTLEALNSFRTQAVQVLRTIADSLGGSTAKTSLTLPVTMDIVPAIAAPGLSPLGLALLDDTRYRTEALGGQLRAALDLVRGAPVESNVREVETAAKSRQRLTLIGTTFRASLTLQSAALRHALRLAITVALGQAIGRFYDLYHYTWLPMTIAIILKPDFSTTYSRGILRLCGTMAGLLLATLLNRWLVPSPWLDICFLTLFIFILRSFGAANYGVFTAAVSGLIVYLSAFSGVDPKEVVTPRAVETVAGGVIALFAYGVWPTWEDTGLDQRFALMLEAYRDYFAVIAKAYRHQDPAIEALRREIDAKRLAARLARANMEASVLRYSAEPKAAKGRLRAISAMMASSHRLAHAFMSLEAGLERTLHVEARPAIAHFAESVDQTLTYLARQMRGTPIPRRDFPDLRLAHHNLVAQGSETVDRYALVNVESDRVANSLNTLTEQARAWQRLMRK